MNQIKRTIRRPELLAKTGLSKTSIYNLEREGKFPRHFMLTPRCAVWLESEVDSWLDERQSMPSAHAPFPDQSLRRSRPGRGALPVVPSVLRRLA